MSSARSGSPPRLLAQPAVDVLGGVGGGPDLVGDRPLLAAEPGQPLARRDREVDVRAEAGRAAVALVGAEARRRLVGDLADDLLARLGERLHRALLQRPPAAADETPQGALPVAGLEHHGVPLGHRQLAADLQRGAELHASADTSTGRGVSGTGSSDDRRGARRLLRPAPRGLVDRRAAPRAGSRRWRRGAGALDRRLALLLGLLEGLVGLVHRPGDLADEREVRVDRVRHQVAPCCAAPRSRSGRP